MEKKYGIFIHGKYKKAVGWLLSTSDRMIDNPSHFEFPLFSSEAEAFRYADTLLLMRDFILISDYAPTDEGILRTKVAMIHKSSIGWITARELG